MAEPHASGALCIVSPRMKILSEAPSEARLTLNVTRAFCHPVAQDLGRKTLTPKQRELSAESRRARSLRKHLDFRVYCGE